MPLISVSSIKIGDRHRKEMGDLKALAESIEKLGLLQSIGITEDFRLVFGERRLRACRDILKQTKIQARTIKISSIVAGEHAENELRKDFTPSERVAIAKALEVEIPERRGNPSIRRKCDELNGRTDELVAKTAGFRNRHAYNRAKKVVENGSTKLIEAMDEGKLAISTAARLASTSIDKQNELLELDARVLRQAARTIRGKKRTLLATNGQHAPIRLSGKNWTLTNNQQAVACSVVIAQPPFGTPKEQWALDELEAFTHAWGSNWSLAGARFIAVFWRQDLLFEGRRWLDEALGGYRFEQLLVWHASKRAINRKATCYDTSWQPIFLYRQVGTICSSRPRANKAEDIYLLDCHIVQDATKELPDTSNMDMPASVMRWLIHGLSHASEQIVSVFCGTATCGSVALELKRRYHGVELDADGLKKAAEQFSAMMPKSDLSKRHK